MTPEDRDNTLLDEAEVAACTTANFMALRQAAAQDGQRRVHSQTGEQR